MNEGGQTNELDGVQIGAELFTPNGDSEGTTVGAVTEVERVEEDEVQITVTPTDGGEGVTLKWGVAATRLVARQLLAASSDQALGES